MKRHFIILFILFYSTSVSSAQFRGGQQDGFEGYYIPNYYPLYNPSPIISIGGNDDGFAASALNAQNGHVFIYYGGSGDGFSSDTSTGLNQITNIWFGGANDGFHAFTSVYSLNEMPDIFRGGENDGVSVSNILGTNLMALIYYGGSEDGFDTDSRSALNLPCDDHYFVWTGAFNEQWHEGRNWACLQVPSIYSSVLIPEGLTALDRSYPIIYGNAEVSTITLQPGAYMHLEEGVLVKLNGN